ncbi:MAG: hypothetical protein KY442_12355, partial [Proteobacteria bacterium]|nr:hypothetical protein [Pseudomonadota bacterium]
STARLFGNPEEPMRGYAQAAAPHQFNLNWLFPTGNPKSPVSDANLGNDPSADVNSGGFCESNDGARTLSPYACTSAVTTDVRISLAGYNRIETTSENNPCPDAANGAKVDRPVCVTYEFESASLTASNQVFNATNVVVAGTGVNQKVTFTMPSITQSGGTVNANFINGSARSASYECPIGATEPVWEANFCE